MKITGIRSILFEHQMARAIGDANNPRGRDQYAALAVFLDTDLGLTGVSLGNPGQQGDIHAMAENLLVGRDPRGVVGLWGRMADFAFKGGNRGAITDVIGALDVALWDLKAKANGEPLWKTLGASSRAVKAYASGIDLCLDDDEIRAFYERQAAQGICIGKLKVGLDREGDLRRIGIMREALATSGQGPDPADRFQRILVAQTGDPAYPLFRAPSRALLGGGAGAALGLHRLAPGIAIGERGGRHRREPR